MENSAGSFSDITMPWTKHKYDNVDGDVGDLPETTDMDSEGSIIKDSADTLLPHLKSRKSPRFRRRSLLFLVSLGLGFITFLIVILSKYAPIGATGRRTTVDQCGTTAYEARERGCVFEVTLSLWVPPACYDGELETEYLQSPGLVFFRDFNLTQEVSLDEVKKGDAKGWWVPWEHHLRHCSFAFRKLHRAAVGGKKIDGYISQYPHTNHCIKMMTDPPASRLNSVQYDEKMFPYCGKPGGYNVDHKHPFDWVG